jgi:hypothetical protein
MLPLVENKRIFAGLRVSRWGWLLHNAAKIAEGDFSNPSWGWSSANNPKPIMSQKIFEKMQKDLT